MKLVQLILSILFILNIGYSSAQIVDRSKDRAVNKTNNRVDRRIDQGIDKGLDSIEGLFKKKDKSEDEDAQETEADQQEDGSKEATKERSTSKEESASQGSYDLSSMFKPAVWESSYTFQLKAVYYTTSTDSKGRVEENEMEMMFAEDVMGMKTIPKKKGDVPALIIIDIKNKTMITLTEDEGEKKGMAIAMNDAQISSIEEQVEEHNSEMTIKKTGKTKTILGYHCEEYEFSGNDTRGNAWVTDEVSYNMSGLLGMMNTKKGGNSSSMYPGGFLMLSDSKDLKSGDSTHFEAKSVKEKANEKVDLAPYNVMDPMSMMQKK
jgi:hypothetical protein